jgi:hypothetical protein
MRTKTFSLLSALSIAVLAACSVGHDDDTDSAESNQTDDDLARSALRVLGAKLPGEERPAATCNQCHDTNKLTLKNWTKDYKTTLDFISDETKSVDERIAFLRRNPEDPATGFAPSKLGILTAGTHFGPGANISADRHPTVFKIATVLSKLFAGKDELYRQFKTDTLMPVEASYDRLTPTEFERILTWVEKGLPKLDELLVEEPRPTTCTDDFAALAEHARSVKSTSWYAVNRDARMPMFACPSDDPLACFTQKSDAGAEIFPESRNVESAKTWSPKEDNFRLVRELEYRTFYWMRTSADGRFVGNGGGPHIDGTSAVIADLGAALNKEGPKTRDIGVNASYDPDFFPANQGFTFHGTSKFCSLAVLKNPATKVVTFNEPECSDLAITDLYQTVGQVSGDNAISDIFVVNNAHANDNPGLTSSDHDQRLSAGPEAAVEIRVGVARGNDASGGYEIKQEVSLPAPFKGDTMMSRTGQLVGSRVAGENGALGYAVDSITRKLLPSAPGYAFTLKETGRICMPGNKANFSFDERFLVTHHYLTRADFDSDEAFAPYKDKGASDIMLADFVTGTKTRISRMNPGQFALFPHFRSDGWLYFLVRDANTHKETIVTTDSALRAIAAHPL